MSKTREGERYFYAEKPLMALSVLKSTLHYKLSRQFRIIVATKNLLRNNNVYQI